MTLKRNLMLATAFVLTAHMAQALTANELAAQFQSEGYSNISVRSGLTQIKIEAYKDGQKVEIIYDAATGAILKQESESVGTLANPDQGPRIREVGRDFVRVGDDDDEEDEDEDEDDDEDEGEDDDSDDDDDDDSDDDDDEDEDEDDEAEDDDDDDGGKGRGRGRGGDDD